MENAIVFCFAVHAGDAPTLVEKTILDGKVTVLLSKDFKPMSEELLRLKYPSDRRPTLVYTNETASVNIAFNHAKDKMLPSQIPNFHKVIEGFLKKLHPTAKWFRSEVKDLNGKKFMIMEFRAPAIDTEVRNIMLGTSFDDRPLIISFNCVKELERYSSWCIGRARLLPRHVLWLSYGSAGASPSR